MDDERKMNANRATFWSISRLKQIGKIGAVPIFLAMQAWAGDTCPPDPQTHVDGIEHWTGATNINGAIGNSGLTAGISLWGELTVLRWPSPSYFDHLNYMTKHNWPGYTCDIRWTPKDAPGTYGLYRRPKVLAENMGSFAGIYYFTGTTGVLIWLKDPFWSLGQTYLTEDSNVLLTRFLHPGLGLKVSQYDFVLPDKDVLVRHYLIERLYGSAVTSASFIYYENLAPGLSKVEGFPVLMDDSVNDFAVAYSSERQALLHFITSKRNLSILDPLLGKPSTSQSEVDSFIEGLQEDGKFIAIGSKPTPTGHQCGRDDFTSCSKDFGWVNQQQGAFSNITTTAGALSGSSIAGCQADAALSYPITFNDLNSAEFTIYFAFAETAHDALSLLDGARSTPYEEHLASTEEFWKKWLSKATLPKTSDPQVIKFSKRALISLKVGQDRDSGAIVASIALQPNYGEDWPRDGSFFNIALDIAGFHELVTKHNLFYARVQRKTTISDAPAGSWDTNYYADGMIGMAVPPFEIDETGFALWTLVSHAKFIEDPCERSKYLKEVYPAVRLAAELLRTCKDPTNNLQCAANEDDNQAFTQTLHGAVTTYMGLVSAVEAGSVLGESPEVVEGWRARAEELKTVILSSYDPSAKRFVKYLGGRGGYWLIWPARVVPENDPRIQDQAEHLYKNDLLPHLLKQTSGFGYINELALALTKAWKGNPSIEQRVQDALRVCFYELPTPGTDLMGEVEITEDLDGDGIPEFQNRVAMPHIWKQTINYLLAMAAFSPEVFDRVEAPLEKSACPKDRGLGCTGFPSTPAHALIFLAPALLILVLKIYWK